MTRLPSEPASKITLAFWLTLVTATGLYGFVSLAPNCLVLGDLVAHSAENRGDERALENRIEYLEQDFVTGTDGGVTRRAAGTRVGLARRRGPPPAGWALRPPPPAPRGGGREGAPRGQSA